MKSQFLPLLSSLLVLAAFNGQALASVQDFAQPDSRASAEVIAQAGIADQLQQIEQQAQSPEELIARKQALLSPKIAADSAALVQASMAQPTDSLAMADAVDPASRQMFAALAAIRAQSSSPEMLIEQTQAWTKINAPSIPAVAVEIPKPDPADEVQSALYDIRHDAQSAEELIATLEEFYRLNPFLRDPNSNPAQ